MTVLKCFRMDASNIIILKIADVHDALLLCDGHCNTQRVNEKQTPTHNSSAIYCAFASSSLPLPEQSKILLFFIFGQPDHKAQKNMYLQF